MLRGEAVGTDKPSSLRLVSIALTSIIAIALVFGVLYIQVRDNGLTHRRLLNYGELERVQHSLRDWSDILQTRAAANAQPSDGSLPRAIMQPVPIEDVVPANLAGSRSSALTAAPWCDVLGGNDPPDGAHESGVLQLSSESRQRRDSRIMLSAGQGNRRRTCSRINVVPLIGDVGAATRVDDLAIIDSQGRVVLPLRGDAQWPARLAAIYVSDPAAEKQASKVLDDTILVERPTREPIEVAIAGEAFDLYAVPLDVGRKLRIVGAMGGTAVSCPPRACTIVALGSRAGLTESYYDLSALTRSLLLALVMMLVALVPIVKLLSIDQNSSLHWLEVAVLVISVPLAAAIALGAVLAVSGWSDERARADGRIRTVALEVANDADAKVDVILNQVLALNNTDDLPLARGECSAAQVVPRLPFPLSGLSIRDLATSKPRWFCNRPNEDNVRSLVTREYFRRIQSFDGLRQFKQTPWFYTVAQIPKLTTGEARLVATMRRQLCQREPKKDWNLTDATCRAGQGGSFIMGVAVAPSEFKRPLPPGYDYAIIDAASFEVLEHSQPNHDFSLHFDRQLIDPGELMATRGALSRGCDRADDMKPVPVIRTLLYEGEMRRMAFTYACAPGWIVASWYARSTVQNTVIGPLRVAVSLFVLLLAVALCVAAAAGVYRRELLVRAVWPRTNSLLPWAMTEAGEDERVDLSREVAVGLGVIAVPAVLLPLWFTGDAQLLAAFVVPLIATFAFLRAFFRPQDHYGPAASALTLMVIAVAAFAATSLDLENLWKERQCAVIGWILWLVVCGVAAWRCRAAGRVAERMLKGAGKWRLRRKSGILSVVDREGSIVTVADKSHASRWLQGWMIAFLVIAPMVLAFSAARDEMHHRSERKWAEADARARPLARNALDAAGRTAQGDEGYPAASNGPDAIRQKASVIPALLWTPSWLDCVPPEEVPARVEQSAPLVSETLAWVGATPPVSPKSQATDKAETKENGTTLPRCVILAYQVKAITRAGVWLTTAAMLAPLLGFVALLFRILNRGLFGLHHFEFRSLHAAGDIGKLVAELDKRRLKRILFVDFPWTKFEDLKEKLAKANGYELLHLGQFRYDRSETPDVLSVKRPWVVMGFESIITNAELRQRALLLMEQLAAQPEARIYFFSEMLPIARLKHQRERELEERRESGAAARNYESEAYRWAELFERFATFREEEDMSPSKAAAFWFGRDDAKADQAEGLSTESEDLTTTLQCWLDSESALSEVIMKEMEGLPSTLARRQIVTFATLPKVDDNPPTKEQINEYLANFLGDYYQSQWVRSSKEEHLVMYHLAHGRFVNANNFTVINNLLTRGLVRRKPDFQLMNESFGYWIRSLEHPRSFERFRHSVANAGAWTLLRVPVLLAAIALSILVTYFERGASGSLLTLIPAVAAAVPLFLSRLSDSKQPMTH